jgi:hypothetical protein
LNKADAIVYVMLESEEDIDINDFMRGHGLSKKASPKVQWFYDPTDRLYFCAVVKKDEEVWGIVHSHGFFIKHPVKYSTGFVSSYMKPCSPPGFSPNEQARLDFLIDELKHDRRFHTWLAYESVDDFDINDFMRDHNTLSRVQILKAPGTESLYRVMMLVGTDWKWIGNIQQGRGPDRWHVSMVGGPRKIPITFDRADRAKAYPDADSAAHKLIQTYEFYRQVDTNPA